MNGSAARAQKREIRRAFGDTAVKVIDAQGDTLQRTVLPLLQAHESRLDLIAVALEENTEAHTTMRLVIHEFLAFRSMTRWQRLRWVLGF